MHVATVGFTSRHRIVSRSHAVTAGTASMHPASTAFEEGFVLFGTRTHRFGSAAPTN
jgi:hypothetical protein